MYKILNKFPQNCKKTTKNELCKWKHKIVKYNKPNIGIIKYNKPNTGIIYSVSRTNIFQLLPKVIPLQNNCKDIIIYDNKNTYKYIIENIIYKKYVLYGLYSCITACVISGISYGYIIYNKLELLVLL